MISSIKKYAPIGFILLAIFATVAGMRIVSSWEKSIYAKGYEAAEQVAAKERAKQEAEARKLEAAVAQSVEKFADETEKMREDLKTKENKYVERIVEKINHIPVSGECRIPDSVLSDRNNIRALGPGSGNAPAPARDGEKG